MKYTGEVILEKIFVDGVNEEDFTDAKDFLKASIEVLADNNEIFNLLLQLNSHSDHLYAHCLCVSMFCIMISRKMGYSSSITSFKLSMAGLLHDIGKKEIDPIILEKPRPLLTYQERQLIETHCTRGKQILSEIKSISSDILQCVYDHHEDCLGQGYPRSIGPNEIHPLAKIICVADIFSQYVIKSPNHPGMSGRKAIEEMNFRHESQMDKKIFYALKQIFYS